MLVLTAAFGSVEVALADNTDWPMGEQGEIAQACYDQGDWPCAFDGVMSVYELAVTDGIRCDDGKDEIQDGGQGCGFTVVLLYDLAVKASLDVLPERRRVVSERYLQFLVNYGVPSKKHVAKGLLLGVNALRLDACTAMQDDVCAAESATAVVALIDGQSPEELEKLIETAGTFDDYPLDLRDTIATARQLMEGTQP
jgi:hypothetical protein